MSAALTHDVFKIPNWKYLFSGSGCRAATTPPRLRGAEAASRRSHSSRGASASGRRQASCFGGTGACSGGTARTGSFPLRLDRGEVEVSIRSCKSALMPFPRTLPIQAKREQNANEAFDPPSTINFQPSTAPNETRTQMGSNASRNGWRTVGF